MNQKTIDFMYELRDLLKKHGAHIETVSKFSLGVYIASSGDGLELSDPVDHKEVQKWLDGSEGSE